MTTVSDKWLKNLVKNIEENGHDYSKSDHNITVAKRKAANRTREQQKQFEWKNRPRIIYTPMGGQNKKH